jgi:hypothetical protein
MMAQTHASQTDILADIIIPSPKINIPPAQFFLKTEETPLRNDNYITQNHDITQESISQDAPISWNAERDIRFTLIVISLVIGINVCIAWLLGAGTTSSLGSQTQEDGIFMQEKAVAPVSLNHSGAKSKHIIRSDNSVYLSAEDRRSLLKQVIISPSTHDLTKISDGSQ